MMSRKRTLIGLIALLGPALASAANTGSSGADVSRIGGGASRLSRLLSSADVGGYAVASEPRDFSFPADHGPHPGFRNEWWYLTGNLEARDGERFGFELTIFRFLLDPTALRESSSRWRSNEVYVGHFAITDVRNDRFHVAQRYSRGSMGLAGARAEPFRVWVEDWSIAGVPDRAGTWRIRASDTDMALDLRLVPLKPPVLNGRNGLSRKSAEPENASYYYSISRLQTEGTINIGDDRFAVSGLSWLDREWSSSALSAGQVGWDWFALQLDDGSDLMFYQLRRHDGSRDAHSAGTWVTPESNKRHLEARDVDIEVTGFWNSPSGGRYPGGWRLVIPALGLRLDVQPVIDDQELDATVRYWEGAVDVSGERNGEKLAGRGYVELTGYTEFN